MLLVPQTAAAASKVLLLCFGFPVLSFRSWSCSVHVLFCFVLSVTSPGGGARHLILFITSYSMLFVPLSLSFFSVIALSALLAALNEVYLLCVVVL